MLKATDIHKSYGNLHVLKGVDIALASGEVVALVGTSGAGKSTLLQILGLLDQPDQGQVFFNDTNQPESTLTDLSRREQATFRNQKLGFVFQFHHLLPEFNALENVCIPGYIAGTAQQEVQAKAKEFLALLGLKERMDHKPSQLSGGEQQRVSVARALINSPQLILADEPTGNLDTGTSEDLYQLIFELARETGVGFLIATHDTTMAAKADRLLRIEDGLMVQ